MIMKLMIMMMMMVMMMMMMMMMMRLMMMATTMSQCLRESWVVCSDCYHSNASKNISVHMSDDTWRLLQAVSKATIVSITADPKWVCPHENLFKIGLNSDTRQSSSATKDSHYFNILS